MVTACDCCAVSLGVTARVYCGIFFAHRKVGCSVDMCTTVPFRPSVQSRVGVSSRELYEHLAEADLVRDADPSTGISLFAMISRAIGTFLFGNVHV